jgi:hypothetical protein
MHPLKHFEFLKFNFFILTFLKMLFRRVVDFPVLIIHSHRRGIGVNFSHRNVKKFHRTVIFTLRELAYEKLFGGFIMHTVTEFNFTVRKFFAVPVLINDRYWEMTDTANPILFKFLILKT